MPPQESPGQRWADDLTASIGRRVAHYRKRSGLTAEDLSAGLRAVGVDMKRTVIGNLEVGHRRTVSVTEILAIAYVVGVPPLMLLVPALGKDSEFEVLPGTEIDTWSAAQWISGEGGQPAGGPPVPKSTEAPWRTNVDLLTLYRKHTEAIADWERQAEFLVMDVSGDVDRGLAQVGRVHEQVLARRRELEEKLRLYRRALRDRGDTPPALPAALAHVDAPWPT